MRTRELRVGRMYAFPTNPGPWYRSAVPARVMAHAGRERVLVMLPDGAPVTPRGDPMPRSSLVWVDSTALVAEWEEWPAMAASTRADMTAVVSSAVAAIAGPDAPSLEGNADNRRPTRWWSRPVAELLRPPPLPLDHPDDHR